MKEVRDTLAGDGYQIAVARNGHLAELVARRRPHLLIVVGGKSEAAAAGDRPAGAAGTLGRLPPILVLAGSEGRARRTALWTT